MTKMMQSYWQTQKKLKAIKAAGKSKDDLVKIMLDGRTELIAIKIEDGYAELSASKLEEDFMEAYRAARKELESQIKQNTDPEELKKMLGI